MNLWRAYFKVFGFDSDRLDWNFAALMAMIYNCSDAAKHVKPPKDFLLRFDSEADESSLDEQIKQFAIQHNARLKGG